MSARLAISFRSGFSFICFVCKKPTRVENAARINYVFETKVSGVFCRVLLFQVKRFRFDSFRIGKKNARTKLFFSDFYVRDFDSRTNCCFRRAQSYILLYPRRPFAGENRRRLEKKNSFFSYFYHFFFFVRTRTSPTIYIILRRLFAVECSLTTGIAACFILKVQYRRYSFS